MNGDMKTNVGLMKIMGEGMEHPGIGSNQIWTIPSLHKLLSEQQPHQSIQETYRTGP
jgi:hypothetical protein